MNLAPFCAPVLPWLTTFLVAAIRAQRLTGGGMHLKARHGGRAFFVSTYVSAFSSKSAPFAGRGLPAVAHRATR